MSETAYEPIKAIVALNGALVDAQAAMPNIAKASSVDTGTFSYTYAPLDLIVSTVRPILADHGLAVVQLLEPGPALRTELRHREGGVLGSSFPFAAPENPKALGSMLTYIRRYALMAILGLATEDDDGSAADNAPVVKPEEMISKAQHAKIGALLKELETEFPTREGQLSWVAQLREESKVSSRKDLTKAQAGEAIEWLERMQEAQRIPL